MQWATSLIFNFFVKWHEGISQKLPKNIKTVTWISLQDLFGLTTNFILVELICLIIMRFLSKWIRIIPTLCMAHPNIRAFISNGGALSTQEVLYFGVPTIVIPLFADQDFIALWIQSRRRGIRKFGDWLKVILSLLSTRLFLLTRTWIHDLRVAVLIWYYLFQYQNTKQTIQCVKKLSTKYF